MTNRIFFDFEFIEDGRESIMEPISLGMVKETGEEFYREFYFDHSRANDWVKKNVLPNLTGDPEITRALYFVSEFSLIDVRGEILDFVGEKPEFWAYFSDYDWVLLCGLFGRMIDLPTGWPMWCRDLKQYMWHVGWGRENLPTELKKEHPHNALEDAKWNLAVFNYFYHRPNMLIRP